MAGILIRNGMVLADGSARRADVAVAGDRIVAVGEVEADGQWERVIDADNFAVMPGFVNTHGHAAMTLLRGIGDDLPLMQWLEREMWPREARLNEDDVYWGTKLAIGEMLKGGTTTFSDMYFHMDGAARAVEESGIRAVLSRGLVVTSEAEGKEKLAESRAFVQKWHGAAGGRISTMLGPHASYTCPPECLRQIAALSDELAVPVQIHLCETEAEVKNSLNEHGMTPVALVAATGLFNRPVLAAHCVHLSEEDIDILAGNSVRIAHNPGSNLKLGSGIAPVPRFLERGLIVGLGTDGAASNNNLDMMEEMRLCALIHKGLQREPTLIPAATALAMATEMGAKALFLSELGQIAPGYKADLLLINLDKLHLTPRTNILSHLVYAAQPGDISLVMADGVVVVEEGMLVNMDEKEIMAEASRCSRHICG